MIQIAATFNIEAMSEVALLSLYARLFAVLVGNTHNVEEQARLLFALQRVKEALRNKQPSLHP